MDYSIYNYLNEHLNVYWLRPESALWDTIASYEISKLNIPGIDIDLGSGNGIFSFITAGGRFSLEFDWFLQVNLSDLRRNIFHYFDKNKFKSEYIIKSPDISFNTAFDNNKIMLKQAKALGWYKKYIESDIREHYPFEDGSLSAVFSNILYWVNEPTPAMREINRVLRKNGMLILCLPDYKFVDFCPTYKSCRKEYRWLLNLNRDRAKCIAKYYHGEDIKKLAKDNHFKIIYHKEYLSKELLAFWDIGLRPLIRQLLKMVSFLTEEERLEVKKEWIEQLKDDLQPVVEREIKTTSPKGFHLCVFQK